ncbi:MAG: NAD-dependent dehydratase [Desulfuromonas sp.]|uniref:UDP-glucuronic acid decarboxylase family protein n=1 Tax=Desulfuromonas sp. TaxID=892 RepID=UPI000CA77A1C|nr:UDP-glucuronic acid decarboxylase family protein [Desulfuromonas sp.]PLX83007.1 MAG: NAD-dependent dehydratase [Desulfuromonas sp.]
MHFKKRVLVTGGAGFIGSHLCEALLRRGCEVLCLDNFLTGSRRNIAHLLDDPYFELLYHDVTRPLSLEVQEVYNLACAATPDAYRLTPVTTVSTCLLGAMNMLNLARDAGAKILQASTSEVYGDARVHPQGEDYWGHVNPIGPRACYDEGKRCAETLFFDYHRQHDVRIKVARIFNTYGPRMHPEDGRVVAGMVLQALRGEPLTIPGEGTQTRSFCYVDDMVEGLVALMESPDGFTGPVNLGNPAELQVGELARVVLSQIGSASEITCAPLPEDDPRQRRPDISLAREALDWSPQIPLQKGLRKTIDYFQEIVHELRKNDRRKQVREKGSDFPKVVGEP